MICNIWESFGFVNYLEYVIFNKDSFSITVKEFELFKIFNNKLKIVEEEIFKKYYVRWLSYFNYLEFLECLKHFLQIFLSNFLKTTIN